MKPKHLTIRIEQCLFLASASGCTQGRCAAMLLDPTRNVVLMDAYRGAPRGGGKHCGGDHCIREARSLRENEHLEIGCHHAEMNLVCNAAANGVRCQGAWMITNGEPCMMCAKMVHHAGISKVIIVTDQAEAGGGAIYLVEHGVLVEHMKDPAKIPGKPESNQIETGTHDCPPG
jgi:dCMP deaminase